MFLLFFDSINWIICSYLNLSLMVLFQTVRHSSTDCKGWPPSLSSAEMRNWETCIFLKGRIITRNYSGEILCFQSTGGIQRAFSALLGTLSSQLSGWELMINLILPYTAITVLMDVEWIADLLHWNKLAFFLLSYTGFSLSKEYKEHRRIWGCILYFVLSSMNSEKLLMIIILFPSSLQH